jgi:TonB family protein
VEALVDEKGRVFAADVVQSVNPELDALTVAAVSKWTFTPAMEDGKAIMKVVRIPVEFNLIDPLEKSVSEAQNGAVATR